MDDNLLKNLILEADAEPQATGHSPAEVAAVVRADHGRRRRRRLAMAATAFVVLGGFLWRIMRQGRLPEADKALPELTIASQIHPMQPERDLRALRAQIDREEQIVEGLLAAERARRLSHEAQAVSQRMTVPVSHDEQIGPAAVGYLVSGDRKREAGLPLASVRSDYVRVVELFPKTSWADQAKARLASLKP
jgi:hypothetical protein